MRLTRTTIDQHHRLRRLFAGRSLVGPSWTILASDTLLTACRLAGVEPAELLLRLETRYGQAQVRRGSPVFAALLRQLPGCAFVRLRSGVMQVRSHGAACYGEEWKSPALWVPGASIPEVATIHAKGLHLSRLIDLDAMPALASLDPTMRSICNKGGLGDERVEIELAIEYRTLTPMPIDVADASGWRIPPDTGLLPCPIVPAVPRTPTPTTSIIRSAAFFKLECSNEAVQVDE